MRRDLTRGGIGLVGDGAREDVGCAAAGVRYADEREFHLLEGAVVVEGEPRELAGAEFIVNVHAGVNFLATVAVRFKAHARLEHLDLCGQFGYFIGRFS